MYTLNIYKHLYTHVYSSFVYINIHIHVHPKHIYICIALNLCIHMYTPLVYVCLNWISVYMYIHVSPPDPISHVCSLTGTYISRRHFTYRPAQILKIMFRRFCSPESDPPHKMMRYWFYYSFWLGFPFPPDHAGLVEMICTTVVPVWKGHLGGASP